MKVTPGTATKQSRGASVGSYLGVGGGSDTDNGDLGGGAGGSPSDDDDDDDGTGGAAGTGTGAAPPAELYRGNLVGGLQMLEKKMLAEMESYYGTFRKLAPNDYSPKDRLKEVCPNEEVWLLEQIDQFWAAKQSYTPNTWEQAGQNFLWLMEEVAQVDCHRDILFSKKCKGPQPQVHVRRQMKEKICGYALTHFAWGQDVTNSAYYKLEQYTSKPDRTLCVLEDDPIDLEQKQVYVFFMLACLAVVVQFLNPGNRLHYDMILETNPGQWRQQIVGRVRTKGTWSQNKLMKLKAKGELKAMHVRGVYWPYVRMLNHMMLEMRVENNKYIFQEEHALINNTLQPPFTHRRQLTKHGLNNRPAP